MLPIPSLDSLLAPTRHHPHRDVLDTPAGRYAGLWKGTFRPANGGPVPFTLRQEDVRTGGRPVLVFPTRPYAPIAIRVTNAGDDGYEAVSQPYADPITGEALTFRLRAAGMRNRLTGRFALHRADDTVALEGTFSALRFGSASTVNYRW